MTNICSLPKCWFTAKEAKIPAATLRALANRNIVAINTLFSPQKYCVISNEVDLLELLDNYSFDMAVVVHNSDLVSLVKKEKGHYVLLAEELDKDNNFIRQPISIIPFAKYIHLYQRLQTVDSLMIMLPRISVS